MFSEADTFRVLFTPDEARKTVKEIDKAIGSITKTTARKYQMLIELRAILMAHQDDDYF